ncbi:MAG: NAD-dependent epimerase/dehydratase family protein [Parachlamydiaceae bacterium]|nr:NAD-dependent epimerase/dehydratase family protein [Parachlamydiaceae bacterium]
MNSNILFEQPDFIPIFNSYHVFKDKKIGITGISGVLGGILYNRLLKNKIETKAYPGDILDLSSLEKWFDNNHFDYFFHFAAVVPLEIVNKYPIKAYATNVIGTFNISKVIVESQAGCWLFLASSSHVYKPNPQKSKKKIKTSDDKNPVTLYGKSKLAGEKISAPFLEYFGREYCIGRIFSFAALNQKEPFLVPTLLRKIERLNDGDILQINNHSSVRDIMDAESVIDSILYIAFHKYNGIINIGSGKATTVKKIAEIIAKKLNKKIIIKGMSQDHSNSLIADINELKKIINKKI